MADSDDEPITLSSNALDALKEFYSERDARARQFEQLKAAAEEKGATPTTSGPNGGGGGGGGGGQQDGGSSAPRYPFSMEAFGEDWNESQFWYSDETANLLARQLLDGATADTRIAVVSAPSAFVALKNILASQPPSTPKPTVFLLEHDHRFGVFPEFVFYDFMQPVKLPVHLKGSIDRFVVDPPFLSEDCQTKAALTVRWMAKAKPAAPDGDAATNPRLILCTGERMEALVTKLYRSFGLRTTDWEPAHARGLSNEFYCYASFECDGWRWRTEEREEEGDGR